VVTTTHKYAVPLTLYSLPLTSLRLHLGNGASLDLSSALFNGRSNYVLFQKVVAQTAGLSPHSEGADSDLQDPSTGQQYEVKAYHDPVLHPSVRRDSVHTAASSTFGANNKGPVIKSFLDAGQYLEALAVCEETGFKKNDFYLYTNTRGFDCSQPLRYIIVPTALVRAGLDRTDPRLISRTYLLGLARRKQTITQV
jgi:hypothetical protein